MSEVKKVDEVYIWLRIAAVAVILGAVSAFLYFRPVGETLQRHEPLSDFPTRFRQWEGSPIRIPANVLAILGPGEFLERTYRRKGVSIPVNLFVAYFPSQRRGDTIHSPQNCLPGNGWVPIAAQHLSVIAPGGGTLRVNRYVIARGLDRMLILYWFEEQGRAVASEYLAKIYLVTDAIREDRTDGALIRVGVPIPPGKHAADVQATAVAFTTDIVPLLRMYIGR